MRRHIGSTTENFTVAHLRLAAEARVWMSGGAETIPGRRLSPVFRLVHTGRRLSGWPRPSVSRSAALTSWSGSTGMSLMSSYNISLPVTGQQELNHTGSRYRPTAIRPSS